MKKKNIALIICAVAIFSAGVTYSLTCMKYKRQIDFCKDNAALLDVYDDVRNDYYKKISKKDLLDYMIKGCIDSCDEEFTSYFTSNMVKENSVNIESSVSRSGFAVDKNRHDEIVVTEVKPDSRADEMGLKADDVITMIDGKTISENGGYYKAIRELLGKDGTTVKLHIRRDREELDINFVRYNVYPDSEKSFYYELMNDDILYIHFLYFDENAVENLENTLNENKYKSIVLDLRNNQGGEVECAAKIFDYFSGEGNKVMLKHERSGKEEFYSTSTDGKEINCDVAVLVNENTISSAEILTAFFKDTGRGKIIGEKTYGKGIFQTQKRLENMLTYQYTAGYVYVNDMPNYDEIGVYPDIEVPMDESLILTPDDIQLQKAIEVLG